MFVYFEVVSIFLMFINLWFCFVNSEVFRGAICHWIGVCPFVIMAKSYIYNHDPLFIVEKPNSFAFFFLRSKVPIALMSCHLGAYFMSILMHRNWQLYGIIVSHLSFCQLYIYHCTFYWTLDFSHLLLHSIFISSCIFWWLTCQYPYFNCALINDSGEYMKKENNNFY